MRRFLLVFAALIFVSTAMLSSGGCTPLDTEEVRSPSGTTTRVIMVRHAERDEGLDPPLNEEGLIRAQALADELAEEGVTAIYYPNLLRNRQTAEPLLEIVDATIRVFSTVESGDTKAMANRFVDEVVSDHAGGVVLWIGNTGPVIEGIQEGNLQEIYRRLGGTNRAPIRYSDFYEIILNDDRAPTFIEGTYGGSSSLD
ncbi:MAG: histidine phosphatase family protein [Phycisphaerae bacterium]